MLVQLLLSLALPDLLVLQEPWKTLKFMTIQFFPPLFLPFNRRFHNNGLFTWWFIGGFFFNFFSTLEPSSDGISFLILRTRSNYACASSIADDEGGVEYNRIIFFIFEYCRWFLICHDGYIVQRNSHKNKRNIHIDNVFDSIMVKFKYIPGIFFRSLQ